MKIAYITYSGEIKYSAANGFNEITGLLSYLQNKGLDIEATIWDDPAVDWTKYDIAILKTPWDYHQKIDAFKAWLDKIESLNIRLLNDYKIVRWNLDKHYLQEIIADGFDVIPSVFLERGWKGGLQPLFETLKTQSVIIKPCISGGSKNTIIVHQQAIAASYEQVVALLADADYIVQPLMNEIQDGEWSYIFFNGKYSHTILKRPKAGDFRVQQIYGGSIDTLYPTAEEIAHAATYVEKYAKECLYVRVDGLMVNGHFVLMELELIEPYLYLSYGENALENYYQAILAQIN
ncbi:ATP-grasp domain-containing protein [Chitinophaga sancti]|uniref:ATP-grasp domain-containing protein n=1 Tax=Chitinophaga sancti TaxID=1004 RepID=UPI003F79E17E